MMTRWDDGMMVWWCDDLVIDDMMKWWYGEMIWWYDVMIRLKQNLPAYKQLRHWRIFRVVSRNVLQKAFSMIFLHLFQKIVRGDFVNKFSEHVFQNNLFRIVSFLLDSFSWLQFVFIECFPEKCSPNCVVFQKRFRADLGVDFELRTRPPLGWSWVEFGLPLSNPDR